MPSMMKSTVRKSTLVLEVVCGHCKAVNFAMDDADYTDPSKMDIEGVTCWNCKKDSYLFDLGGDFVPEEDESINLADGRSSYHCLAEIGK